MVKFHADSIVVCCSNVEAAKRWWIETFGCRETKLPAWDNPLPSDVALKLPGNAEPTVLLCARAELSAAGLSPPATGPIIFVSKIKKAYEYLLGRNLPVGPIQNDGAESFFEIHDLEGNPIEVCQES